MNYIGLDIGTTSISGVAVDLENRTLLASKTVPNNGKLTSQNPWEALQNPDTIIETVFALLTELQTICPDAAGIGITGQMHGILYVDRDGNAASPLYTWQDEQGNQMLPEGCTYSEKMSQLTGYPLATGFGLLTHYILTCEHKVPKNAVSFCTIPDYLAMKLTSNAKPQLHPSMAASLGCFSLKERTFDTEALSKAFTSLEHLPMVSNQEVSIGQTVDGIPVFPAIGDNQASFLGSVTEDDSLLVNVGTGSQISVLMKEYTQVTGMECRPYIQNQYLLVHSPLCGGYSYSLLHHFFEETAQMLGVEVPSDLYAKMNQAAASVTCDEFKVTNHFLGTRSNPNLRGTIQGMTPANFTPAHLTRGILEGICQELYTCYEDLPCELKTAQSLTGSGNGLRRNPLLQQIFQDAFHLPLHLSQYEEEAACGAAIFASLKK